MKSLTKCTAGAIIKEVDNSHTVIWGVSMKKFLLCMIAAVMLLLTPAVIGETHAVLADETQQTGWVKENGAIYYYNSSHQRVVGKQKINGYYYYFRKKGSGRGQLRTGIVKIKKVEYYFKKTGKIGVIGRALNGWVKIKNRGFCYCDNGRILKNCWVQDYYVTGNGAMNASSTRMFKLTRKTVKSLCNNSMTKLQKLRRVYEYLCSSSFRYVTKRPFSYASSWRLTYGYEMLTTHSGVCYNFAAALAYMARYIGFTEVKAIAGELLYLEGYWDLHSWTKIKVNGTWYVFDASMEHGGRGNFYMKSYAGTGRKYREWSHL